MKTTIDALNRRYATKKFDEKKKVSEEDINILLESLILSPSSFGLQPWRFIRVKDQDIRNKLQEASRGQPQITQASDLFVLAVKTNMQESDVEEYIQSMISIRWVDKTEPMSDIEKNKLSEYKKMMVDTVSSKTTEELKRRNQKQVYIALWVLLTTCASMNIDSCPMEWFDPSKYNEILWLDKLWLTATLVVPVWYRAEDDKYSQLAKVRFSKEKLVIEI